MSRIGILLLFLFSNVIFAQLPLDYVPDTQTQCGCVDYDENCEILEVFRDRDARLTCENICKGYTWNPSTQEKEQTRRILFQSFQVARYVCRSSPGFQPAYDGIR